MNVNDTVWRPRSLHRIEQGQKNQQRLIRDEPATRHSTTPDVIVLSSGGRVITAVATQKGFQRVYNKGLLKCLFTGAVSLP